MNDENVINLNTGRSFLNERTEAEAAQAKYDELEIRLKDDHIDNSLEMLDRVKDLLKAGKLDGLIITGRNPENGLFFSSIMVNASTTRADVHLAYAGQLEALKLECLDDAGAGPHMDLTGEYFGFLTPEDLSTLEEDE